MIFCIEVRMSMNHHKEDDDGNEENTKNKNIYYMFLFWIENMNKAMFVTRASFFLTFKNELSESELTINNRQ